MTSTTLTGQNANSEGSKLPIPIPNTNASANQAKKPPFESRKSAEELKLRLASAVSAKIALGGSKDGRNSSSSNTTNRGIGLLLQRKEQQENRLNTKDISFQKPARNGGGKPVELMAKNTKSINGKSKAELQKSLLSALMNSRAPSGANSGQKRARDSRLGTASKLNADTKSKTTPSEINKTPLATPKATSETDFANESTLETSSTANKGKSTTTSEFNNKPLSTLNQKSGNLPNKSPLQPSNGASGGILDRAKNIERLLAQRKQETIPVNESITATKDAVLNRKAVSAEPNKRIINSTEKKSGDFNVNKTATTTKPVENGKEDIARLNGKNNLGDVKLNKVLNTTRLLGSARNEGDNSVLNGRTSGGFKSKTTQPVENTAKEGVASINGENNGKFGVNKSPVETKKPFENVGKKIPPPVAKKPSKEGVQIQKSKQSTPPLPKGDIITNGKMSSQNATRTIAAKSNSPQIKRETNAVKVDALNSKTANALSLNGTNSGKDVAFREDLLEKLEAEVGSCKIAAFQSMEDFSVLRMKVYRIRGELDQLKRDREKRTPLVC